LHLHAKCVKKEMPYTVIHISSTLHRVQKCWTAQWKDAYIQTHYWELKGHMVHVMLTTHDNSSAVWSVTL